MRRDRLIMLIMHDQWRNQSFAKQFGRHGLIRREFSYYARQSLAAVAQDSARIDKISAKIDG